MSGSQRTNSRPSHHANASRTAFTNPWPSARVPTWGEVLQSSFPLGWYKDGLHGPEKSRKLEVVAPDWGKASLEAQGLDKSGCVIGTWLGHASAMVELPPVSRDSKQQSVWLLFDPIFSLRAGPTQFSGVARFKQSPCRVDDIPGCDAVFISHNHYDHLDTASIQALLKHFPKAKYFVPLGIKSWMTSTGVPGDLVHELDWWQNRELSITELGLQDTPKPRDSVVVNISCVPAQHNSGRTGADQGKTLWCGWVIERFLRSTDESTDPKSTRKGSIYHAGDTGYRRTARSEEVCPVFEDIGKRFGPFDLSFIPIWRGGTLGFISYMGLRLSHHDIPSAVHGSPTDAVAIHLDVKSRHTLGVHFGTFVGSENETHDALIELRRACEDSSVAGLDDREEAENGRVGAVNIGESYVVTIQ